MLDGLRTTLKRYLWDRRNYKFLIRNYSELTDLTRAADVMETLRFSRILTPALVQVPGGKKIVLVAPHPDDEVMGPGGSLILALARGCKVTVVYLTDVAETAREARESASVLGYETVFLDFPLHAIPLSERSLKAFAEAIESAKPDYLWIPFLLDDHDDHRRASHLLRDAVVAGFIESRPEVWAYQVYTSLVPNALVDITAVAAQKRKAITRFESQASIRDWPHYILGLNAFNTRFLKTDAPQPYAETFFSLPLMDLWIFAASTSGGTARTAITFHPTPAPYPR